MTAAMTGMIVTIEGHVQGVGFRFFTREAAHDFGVNGFVSNMNDGSVYVEAFGPIPDVRDFIAYITEKGRCGLVTRMTVKEVPYNPDYSDFTIQRLYEY